MLIFTIFRGCCSVWSLWNPSSLNPANVSITMQISSSQYTNTQILKQQFHQKGSPKNAQPNFWPNFLYGVKFTQVSAHPGVCVHAVWSKYTCWHMIHKALDTPLLHGLIGGFGPPYAIARSFLRVMNQSQAILCQRSTGEKRYHIEGYYRKVWVGEKGHYPIFLPHPL